MEWIHHASEQRIQSIPPGDGIVLDFRAGSQSSLHFRESGERLHSPKSRGINGTIVTFGPFANLSSSSLRNETSEKPYHQPGSMNPSNGGGVLSHIFSDNETLMKNQQDQNDIDSELPTSCSACGSSIDPEEWHPTTTTKDENDRPEIHIFCGEDCEEQWIANH